MSPRPEIEGESVMGWPDRKRVRAYPKKDQQGRVVLVRTPFWDMQGLITPTDLRYVIIQMEPCEPVHPDDWSLSVSGEVNHPLQFNFEEIRKLPAKTVRCVTECSGHETELWNYSRNGGPKPDRYSCDGVYSGLASSGEWVGVPLATVLKKAGLRPNAVSVRAEGFDRGNPRGEALTYTDESAATEMNYDKCLPLEKALDPDTLLAWALNSEYLRHVHGAPLRLIVPGWSGHWSVKWLQKLEVLDHMAPCFFQTQFYFYARSPEDPDRKLITTMGVKSFITDPRDSDSPIPCGSHMVRGLAWSGCGAITRVEVSFDQGHTWHDAHMEEPREKWLWARWSYLWDVKKPGKYSIIARAADEAGRVQPQTEWNFLNFNFDGIVPVDIEVRANCKATAERRSVEVSI